MAELVEHAARLERSRLLKILGFEIEADCRPFAQDSRAQQRRTVDASLDDLSGRQDVVQGGKCRGQRCCDARNAAHSSSDAPGRYITSTAVMASPLAALSIAAYPRSDRAASRNSGVCPAASSVIAR